MAAVPVLVSLTDRIDPRRILLASLALSALASVGFALVVDGFWSAAAFRLLGGVGLAGSYMPGMKALGGRAIRRFAEKRPAYPAAVVRHHPVSAGRRAGRDRDPAPAPTSRAGRA